MERNVGRDLAGGRSDDEQRVRAQRGKTSFDATSVTTTTTAAGGFDASYSLHAAPRCSTATS
eukprot:31353-Pelagococcus_subviridis.AAC.9